MMKYAIISMLLFTVTACVVNAQVSDDASSTTAPVYDFKKDVEGLIVLAEKLDILNQGVRICAIVLTLILGALHFRLIILAKNQSRWW